MIAKDAQPGFVAKRMNIPWNSAMAARIHQGNAKRASRFHFARSAITPKQEYALSEK